MFGLFLVHPRNRSCLGEDVCRICFNGEPAQVMLSGSILDALRDACSDCPPAPRREEWLTFSYGRRMRLFEARTGRSALPWGCD
jgi:hypothetical protein